MFEYILFKKMATAHNEACRSLYTIVRMFNDHCENEPDPLFHTEILPCEIWKDNISAMRQQLNACPCTMGATPHMKMLHDGTQCGTAPGPIVDQNLIFPPR